ncbi:hypothetical protein [Alkalicoccus halolimnae]|uniref:DUF4306 domain-containing protein n=1 Tax=Alkalicoccus halolimnae TaxID=1667239 RepID=A0A5C7F379_9BACI|nr:hypothetical protein [Alkalicoccus halolimnae]TXF81843.1 hypothetical protein FTX54_15490 [Alkalicoccus halolimnae]
MTKGIYIGTVVFLFAVSAVLGGFLSFFINQMAVLPIEECRSMFVFTPDNAATCSDMHTADAVLAQFRSPLIYIFLLSVILLIITVVKLIWETIKDA